jgi:hypothetical protein
MANFVMPPKTLRVGVDELLYGAAGGAVNAAGAMGTFAIPPQSSIWRAGMVIIAVPVGGTVTTATFNFEVAMFPQNAPNGQSAFAIYNKMVGITGAPSTLTSYSALPLIATGVANAVAIDMTGLGGNGLMRLNFTGVTLGTGTGFDVYAHIG